jgi:hypothetical protein
MDSSGGPAESGRAAGHPRPRRSTKSAPSALLEAAGLWSGAIRGPEQRQLKNGRWYLSTRTRRSPRSDGVTWAGTSSSYWLKSSRRARSSSRCQSTRRAVSTCHSKSTLVASGAHRQAPNSGHQATELEARLAANSGASDPRSINDPGTGWFWPPFSGWQSPPVGRPS